ncbi:hypothetical protein KUCAC02_025177 [Chaenocephalus aceratus]|nr:hypothetical protein KUCAC02_025177 [Chaenocephalus aceratus]
MELLGRKPSQMPQRGRLSALPRGIEDVLNSVGFRGSRGAMRTESIGTRRGDTVWIGGRERRCFDRPLDGESGCTMSSLVLHTTLPGVHEAFVTRIPHRDA